MSKVAPTNDAAASTECSGHNYIPVSDKWKIGVDLCLADSGRSTAWTDEGAGTGTSEILNIALYLLLLGLSNGWGHCLPPKS